MSISSDASSAFENKPHNEQMSDSGSENGEDKYNRELLPIKKRRGSEVEIEIKVRCNFLYLITNQQQ